MFLTLQERAETLEMELAKTSAQLKQLQIMQTAVMTKNQLLEKLLRLNKQADLKSVLELPTSVAVSLLDF